MSTEQRIIDQAANELALGAVDRTGAKLQLLTNELPQLHREILSARRWNFALKIIRPIRKDENGEAAVSLYGDDYYVYPLPQDFLGHGSLLVTDQGIRADVREKFLPRPQEGVMHIRTYFSRSEFSFEYVGQVPIDEKLPSYYIRLLAVALAERVASRLNPQQKRNLIGLRELRENEAWAADQYRTDNVHAQIGGASSLVRAAGTRQSGYPTGNPYEEFGTFPYGPFEA